MNPMVHNKLAHPPDCITHCFSTQQCPIVLSHTKTSVLVRPIQQIVSLSISFLNGINVFHSLFVSTVQSYRLRPTCIAEYAG